MRKTFFISIPIAIIVIIGFWYELINTINGGGFDSLPAWIIGGIVVHVALAGISYNAWKGR